MTIEQATAILNAERIVRSVGCSPHLGITWADLTEEAFGVVDADPTYAAKFDDLRPGWWR